jgi:hypothetical protein
MSHCTNEQLEERIAVLEQVVELESKVGCLGKSRSGAIPCGLIRQKVLMFFLSNDLCALFHNMHHGISTRRRGTSSTRGAL